MLRLYNTASRKKEIFVSHKSGEVKMYVCGVTVYDHCHLGHARAAVVFDVLYRYLKQKGYAVTYVRNFTDVDDKIIKRAAEQGIPWDEVARTYIASYEEDAAALKVLPPTLEPKATDYIDRMLNLVTRLVEKGVAYEAGGDVFFEVRKFAEYGKLCHKPLDELSAGARIEINEAKRYPLDFVLWKKAKPGEPSWPSPWGPGRPGWHIECSAMALDALGERIDIHGGGRDLMFPHHENEIAQSEAATDAPFVKYWVHNGIVNLGKSKMSKSTGNFLTAKDLLAKYDYETIRLFVLAAHYRSPLDYAPEHLQSAAASLVRFYETLRRLRAVGITDSSAHRAREGEAPEAKTDALPREGATRAPIKRSDARVVNATASLEERYTAAMDDDLNTAQVVAAVFEFVHIANKVMDEGKADVLASDDFARFEKAMRRVASGLGVFDIDGDFIERQKTRVLAGQGVSEAQILALIDERRKARTAKDWARSDAIRDELAALGVRLKDRPDGGVDWMCEDGKN